MPRLRVRVVAFRGDETLVMLRRKQSRDYATLVGGKLLPGEDPAVGALRELREETGLAGRLLHRLPDVVAGEQLAYLVACAGEPVLGGPEARKQSPWNLHEPAWVPIAELRRVGLKPAGAYAAVHAALALR